MREQVLRTAKHMGAGALSFASQTFLGSPLFLAKVAAWTLGFYFAHWKVDLGGPYLVVSACWLVWSVGFSDRTEGEVSAYTVFNEGLQALPGQLRGEDLQRDLVGM